MGIGSEVRGCGPASAPQESIEPDGAVGPVASDQVATAAEQSPARAAVPSLLLRERAVQYREEFIREYTPVGPTELSLVGDLARHAAAMELWEEATGAVERQAARGLPCVARTAGDHGDATEDAVLAGSVSPDLVDRCERYGLAHTRAFHRARHGLEKMQTRRAQRESTATAPPPNPFSDESRCEAYLRNRFEQGLYRCPRCGCQRGHYLKARRCWECGNCKRQAGLRAGTVAAESALPLVIWFAAIRMLLWRPTIGTAELGHELGISRLTTVRNLARKIRHAMAEENAGELLAGLDTFYARRWATPPESGARESKKPCVSPEPVRSLESEDASPVDGST